MSEQIRQLAVIMFTDIAGYTTMMGDDDSKAFSLLKINRKLHKKWLDRYNGKWLKEMGDGVLASFTSVSDAIYCAGAIQKEALDIPDLNLRIGIHLGEVICEVGDVFGDGVNIASRIESQADAGSIYVSDTVYRNLTNKKGVAAEFVKEEVLKNVKHPVKIYKVSIDHTHDSISDKGFTDAEKRRDVLLKKRANAWKRPTALIVTASFLFLLGFFLYNQFGNNGTGSDYISRTVIVLPFENLGSPDDDYFAKGITDEITSRLSMIKDLSIISPLSAARFKESGMTIEEFADELGVDYVLDGSIRWDKGNTSQRVRITPRLTSVSNNRQVWANNYDRDLDQIFEVQSEIAEKVSQALDVTLLQSERKSLQIKLTENIKAYDLYLQGVAASSEISHANFRMAEEYFEKAIALDPNFAAAYARLGANHADHWWHYFDRDSIRLDKAKASIDRANKLNPDLFEVKLASGQIHYHAFREYDEALEHLNDALEMKPGNSEVLSYLAYVKRRQGEYRDCINYLLQAYESDPLSSNIPFTLGETYEILREYDKAISFYDRGILLSPDWHGSYAQKAITIYHATGDLDRAIDVLMSSLNKLSDKEIPIFELANFYYLNLEYDEALNTLKQLKEVDVTDQFKHYNQYQLKGDIYLAKGQHEVSKIYFDSARVHIENRIRENPREQSYRSMIGHVYARLGMNKKAIAEGILATQLMPQTLDNWSGYERQLDLARIYSLTEENELALEKIDYLLSTPGNFTKIMLEVEPVFENLRDLPAYTEIMEKQY
ncbi:MAG: hypothetical protein DRI83_07835 [Bacteroidetes bacterium]|nr:MAG: hypothetical protein DRI83_07835 [Bacteroidota bacterium]